MQRLVADAMLAKLARWLRLTGVSVEDAPHVSDDRIIKYVRRKRALLLTSDYTLAGRSHKRKFRVLLVKEKDLEHQLAFVANELGLDISRYPYLGRICTICNGRLRRVSKKNVIGKVGSMAYDAHPEFYACRKCGRIYWYGTHWKAIGKRLKRTNSILTTMQKKKREQEKKG